jgi:hypothetical protein
MVAYLARGGKAGWLCAIRHSAVSTIYSVVTIKVFAASSIMQRDEIESGLAPGGMPRK